jgi:hypothetical protein
MTRTTRAPGSSWAVSRSGCKATRPLARAGGCSANWTMAWATTSVMPVLPTSSCRLTATKAASFGSAGDVVVFRGLVCQSPTRTRQPWG